MLELEMDSTPPPQSFGGAVHIVRTTTDFGAADAIGSKFKGTCSGAAFDANLNPDAKENNLSLGGTVKGDRISGVWYKTDAKGAAPMGSFELIIPRK